MASTCEVNTGLAQHCPLACPEAAYPRPPPQSSFLRPKRPHRSRDPVVPGRAAALAEQTCGFLILWRAHLMPETAVSRPALGQAELLLVVLKHLPVGGVSQGLGMWCWGLPGWHW